MLVSGTPLPLGTSPAQALPLSLLGTENKECGCPGPGLADQAESGGEAQASSEASADGCDPLLIPAPQPAGEGRQDGLDSGMTARPWGALGAERRERGWPSRGLSVHPGLWSGAAATPLLPQEPAASRCLRFPLTLVSHSFKPSWKEAAVTPGRKSKSLRPETRSRSASGAHPPRTCRWPSCWESTVGRAGAGRHSRSPGEVDTVESITAHPDPVPRGPTDPTNPR